MTDRDKLARDISLFKKLQRTEPVQPVRVRADHPKGWEPGIKFTADDQQTITTSAMPKLDGDDDYRSVVESIIGTLPEGYQIRLVEARYDEAAWTRTDADQKYATTKPVWRYRFAVEPYVASQSVDGVAILNALKRSKPKGIKPSGDGTLVLNLNDTQIGKDAGGGTEATLERLDHYFDLAVERAKEVSRGVDDLVLLLGGDLVEGCSIYPNQSFQIDLDRRAQIRTMTGVLLDMLDRLAPEFNKVRVLAVGGNHGEHRLNGKRVNRHDNDDQLVAEGAAMAAERDPKLAHVAFTIAYEQPALTMDIQGHILALTHGSVYGKSASGAPATKAYNWFKNMAASRHPVGDADILVGNHYHHEIITNFGNLLFVQNPAMDGGSPEFADYSGTDCAPGMATWVMNKQSRLTGYEVLR